MRVTIQLLPLILLILFLPYSLVHQFTVLQVLLITVGLLVLRTGLVMYKLSNRMTDQRIILETISISHYVEKVRWCLDYLDIPYVEEENVGILGILLLGRTVPQLQIPGAGLTIGNSSDILRYLYGKYSCDEKKSSFLKPTPLSLSLEDKFDQLGADLRRFAYHTIFSNLSSSKSVQKWQMQVWGLHQPNIPQWQKLLLKIISPIFVKFVETKLNVNAAGSEKSLANAHKVIDEVEDLLSDGRKFLLNTPEPTYIDFHFCSMVAVITGPETYGGKIFSKETREDVGEMPEAWISEVKKLEERVAGKYVQDVYKTCRLTTVKKLD